MPGGLAVIALESDFNYVGSRQIGHAAALGAVVSVDLRTGDLVGAWIFRCKGDGCKPFRKVQCGKSRDSGKQLHTLDLQLLGQPQRLLLEGLVRNGHSDDSEIRLQVPIVVLVTGWNRTESPYVDSDSFGHSMAPAEYLDSTSHSEVDDDAYPWEDDDDEGSGCTWPTPHIPPFFFAFCREQTGARQSSGCCFLLARLS